MVHYKERSEGLTDPPLSLCSPHAENGEGLGGRENVQLGRWRREWLNTSRSKEQSCITPSHDHMIMIGQRGLRAHPVEAGGCAVCAESQPFRCCVAPFRGIKSSRAGP